MSRLLYAFTLALILPISAQATSTASIINTNCSGSLTSSLIDGASFACAGNLTLDGGFITSDSVINISADGDLFLDNLIFTAPIVNFYGLLGIHLGNGVKVYSDAVLISVINPNITLDKPKDFLNDPQIGGAIISVNDGGDLGLKVDVGDTLISIDKPVVGGSLVIGSGGSITTGGDTYNPPIVLSAVPEPSTYAMVFLGLALILLKRRV